MQYYNYLRACVVNKNLTWTWGVTFQRDRQRARVAVYDLLDEVHHHAYGWHTDVKSVMCQHKVLFVLLSTQIDKELTVLCGQWFRHKHAKSSKYLHYFNICEGIWTYYGGVPDLIQVGQHQFIENTLIITWVDLMLTAWWFVHSIHNPISNLIVAYML
jgi:hypothetical protein